MSKSALGRGLGALLSGGAAKPASPTPSPAQFSTPSGTTGSAVRRVPLTQIQPSPLQPRKDFPPESLAELADSIREQGIVQPLIVRLVGGSFELIAGERRWRAAQLAGLTEAPIIERAATDREVLELALIENLQRENLNPVEEALGYAQLGEQFKLTQEEIAKKVGKSRAVVANALRLLKLAAPIQAALRDGRLSVGHAKVILGLDEAKLQLTAFERVLKDGLTVRGTETLVAVLQSPKAIAPVPRSAPAGPLRDLHVVDLENKLRERFAAKVALRYKAGKGTVEVRFANDDELNRVLEVMGVNLD
jgi:ParB family chromosome partitioning protein